MKLMRVASSVIGYTEDDAVGAGEVFYGGAFFEEFWV